MKFYCVFLTLLACSWGSCAQEFIIPDVVDDYESQEDKSLWENGRLLLESVAGRQQRGNESFNDYQRASLDLIFNNRISNSMNVTFSNRYDFSQSHGIKKEAININSFRELYLTYSASDSLDFEFGRINKRFGEAIAYNPTDHFKENSLRSITSVVPASLKMNRIGAIMLASKYSWNGGGSQVVYSPKIDIKEDNGSLSTEISKTNSTERLLLSTQHKVFDNISPELIFLLEDNKNLNIGVNLSALLSDGVVGYFEYNYTNDDKYYCEVIDCVNEPSWASQFSLGFKANIGESVVFVAEYQHDGFATDADVLATLFQDNKNDFFKTRSLVFNRQGLLTQDNLFMSIHVSDVFVEGLVWSSFLRLELSSGSKQIYSSASYYLTEHDIELSLFFRKDLGEVHETFNSFEGIQFGIVKFW